MTILYNCRHDGDQYRITKFDDDMNPQGSYLLSLEECECPAGVRPTCRHRQMLPKFIARSHIGDEWMFDFDRGGWVQMGPEFVQLSGLQEEKILMGFHNPPEGVTMITLGDPELLYNTIADAVGEPRMPPSPTHIKRRL